MKLAFVLLTVAFTLCAGAALGEETTPREGKESLTPKSVVVSSKSIANDSVYDEEVTRENSTDNVEMRTEKSPPDENVEINIEVIR